jgi:hypothetical protein
MWNLYPENISTDSLQQTAVLGTSHIIRKVLQCGTGSLSGGVTAGTREVPGRKPVTRDNYDGDDYDNNNNNENNNNRGIALLIPDLGARRGWVVSTTSWPLYPRERPGTHCTGGWVDPRAGLDVCEKSRPHRDSIP